MMKFQTSLRSARRPDSQTNQPPVSILIYFQISMSSAGNRAIRIIPVTENRIMGTRLIRSKWRICSLHGNHMSIFCATLCKKQIIFSIQLVNMRSLRTDSAASMTDTYTFGQLFSCVWIDFTHKNSIPVIFISGSRVGDDFYLVNSTFEFYPGVPVYHSKNLVNWELINYCLRDKEQLYLDGVRPSGGIYAPMLCYHNGEFFMTTTNVSHKGHLIVHTSDIYGKWSKPVWIDQGGIDPTLLFDGEDVYFASTSKMMKFQTSLRSARRPDSQTNQPPVSILLYFLHWTC